MDEHGDSPGIAFDKFAKHRGQGGPDRDVPIAEGVKLPGWVQQLAVTGSEAEKRSFGLRLGLQAVGKAQRGADPRWGPERTYEVRQFVAATRRGGHDVIVSSPCAMVNALRIPTDGPCEHAQPNMNGLSPPRGGRRDQGIRSPEASRAVVACRRHERRHGAARSEGCVHSGDSNGWGTGETRWRCPRRCRRVDAEEARNLRCSSVPAARVAGARPVLSRHNALPTRPRAVTRPANRSSVSREECVRAFVTCVERLTIGSLAQHVVIPVVVKGRHVAAPAPISR